MSGAVEERSLLSLADGSQISNCSLPCTTHHIYVWLTHKSKRKAPTAAKKGELIDGDRTDVGQDTKGSPKKEKKKEDEEIVTAGKDDMRMEEDGDDMDDTEESPKKEQQIIFIFSQQVISDQ